MKFPDKIEAAEIEDGINKKEYFPLCIEIAKRYNEHDSLIQRIKYLENLIKESSQEIIENCNKISEIFKHPTNENPL